MPTSEIKGENANMPQRFIFLYTHAKSLTKMISSPLLGFGGYLTFLQILDIPSKPIYAVAGGIVIAILSYLAVRTNAATTVKVKEIDTSESTEANRNNLALKLFDRGMLEAKEAREFFKETSAQQRSAFLEELKEARNHYEEKELRQSYHDRLAESNKLCNEANTKFIKTQFALRNYGIEVYDDGGINFPEYLIPKRIGDGS